MLTPEAFAKTQKSIYQKLQEQIQTYRLSHEKDFHHYQRTTERSDYKIKRALDTAELVDQTLERKLILFGDFHPFPQSQKGFFRFLKLYFNKKKKIVVALEIFHSKHQKFIENYLAGKISLGELFEEIELQTYWPFQLEDYAEIVRFCKNEKIPIVGINSSPKGKGSSLKARDKHSAEIIKNELSKNPHRSILCLIGDFHLHKSHLPKFFLKNQLSIVHQNLDSLYFRSIKKFHRAPEVVELASNEYCTFNSVPWVKQQSYLDWLEGGFDDSSELDAFEQIHQFANELQSIIGSAKKWTPTASIFIFPEKPKIQSNIDELFFRHSFRFFRTSYLPDSQSIVLPTLSSNAKAEAASLLLWTAAQKNSREKIKKLSDEQIIYIFFLGFLGSKILNPNRKCNEILDLYSLMQQKSKNKRAAHKAAVALSAIKYLSKFLSLPKCVNKKTKISEQERIEALRLTGYILANRFFHGLRGSMKDRRSILKRLFQLQLSNQNEIKTEFAEMKKIVQKKGISPVSKRMSL